MQLVTIDDLPRTRAGMIQGKDVLSIPHGLAYFNLLPWAPVNVIELLEAGERANAVLRELELRFSSASEDQLTRLRRLRGLTPLESTPLRAPIESPRTLLSGGGNFISHMEEMTRLIRGPQADSSHQPPQRDGVNRGYASRRPPSAHTKNAGSIIGPDAPIVLPARAPDMVDWEMEFAVVFGRACHNVSEDEAMDYVAGYTFVNDLGPRDPALASFADVKAGKPMDFTQIGLAKSMPTMCPLGPCVATKESVPDPDNVRFWLKVNGKIMQDANTSEMVYPVRKMVAQMSKWYGFHPGDVLTMGSPAGVGFAQDPQVFLREGDVVEIGSDQIGILRNPVIRGKDRGDPLWPASRNDTR